MDIEDLRQALEKWVDSLQPENERFLRARLSSLKSVFPFNEYEYILMFLLGKSAISLSDYEELRESYVQSNKYLPLYEISPRIFGQVWAEQHLIDIDSRFQKPSRSLDPDYAGNYDLWMEGIRVEAKASRAADQQIRGPIVTRALTLASEKPFWMNFQQIKVEMCDVFIFIGVWVDEILYWVMSDSEVRSHPGLSHQHAGGIEYQIGLTNRNIEEFDKYLVDVTQLGDIVLQKGGIKTS